MVDHQGDAGLSDMCHAFRTPLNVIFGFSDMLEDPTFGAEERKEIVSRIRAAATELLGLVESQLSAAEVEAVRSVLASSLPANEDEPSREQPAITDAAAVLVVEDDSDVREAMIGVLEASGYPAVPAENGMAAFAALEAGLRPGVILLDLMMPVMDGWQFRSKQLRHRDFASIPTIVCSALRENPALSASLRGAAFVPKPVDFERLLGLVDGYCARG